MQTHESLADLPEALPLQRVSPFWRILAVLVTVLLIALVLVTCVLGIALLHKPVTVPVVAATVATPAPVPTFPPAAFAPMQPPDETVDPSSVPYPIREDLGPSTTADKAGGDAKGTRRSRFLSRSQEVWQSTKPLHPDLVAVSPDGISLAFAAGAALVAGPGSDLKEIDPSPAGAVPPNMGVVRGRGMGFIMGGMSAVPSREDRARVLQGAAAWTSDGRSVYFARACGHLWRCDVASGGLERLALDGSSPVPVPDDRDQIVFVRSSPVLKADLPGRPAPPDRTEVVTANLRDNKVRVLVPSSPSSWRNLAVSPDGKRLALVSDRGYEHQDPRRWRVFAVELNGSAEPRPLTPPALSVGSVCWSADGKHLVYSRSQEPPPAEFWTEEHGGANRELDLFVWDFAGGRETRISRGGGCYSPNVTSDGELYFLASMDERRGSNVRLQKMSLAAALAYASEDPDSPSRTARGWAELAPEVLQQAGLSAEADGVQGNPESLARLADGFDKSFRQRFQTAPPATVAGFDHLRREVRVLDLPPEARRQLAIVLGAAEGEFLRRKGLASWALGPGPLLGRIGPAGTENTDSLFGCVCNPFHIPPGPVSFAARESGDDALGEMVRRAQGRMLVLTNDQAAGQKAVDALTDPDLDRAVALLKEDRAKAATVLLDLCRSKKHERNDRLALYVGTLLHEHGLKGPLLDLATWLCDREPCDARKFNLLGLALLLPPQARDDPDANPTGAIGKFRDALRCDLTFGVGYLNLALAYQRAGDPTAARGCLLRYLEILPQGRYAADAQLRLAELIR
jgi:hypothetical protein